jgi:transposase
MRGLDERNGSLFSYVSLEVRIPARHPLRKVLVVVNDALKSLDAEFAQLYARDGRPSIPPERLLRAALVQIPFTVRSERQLMDQMQYNLLFRWFVGLGIDNPVWVPTVFTKNRDRLLNTEIARKLLAAVLVHKEVASLFLDEHFSVDGTLIEAWTSMKSLQPKPPPDGSGGEGGAEEKSPAKPASRETEPSTTTETTPMTTTQSTPQSTTERTRDRNGEVDFRGQKRSNETHQSTTDPQARLYRKGKGKPAQLCFMGHADGEPLGPDRRGRADAAGRARRARGRHRDD